MSTHDPASVPVSLSYAQLQERLMTRCGEPIEKRVERKPSLRLGNRLNRKAAEAVVEPTLLELVNDGTSDQARVAAAKALMELMKVIDGEGDAEQQRQAHAARLEAIEPPKLCLPNSPPCVSESLKHLPLPNPLAFNRRMQWLLTARQSQITPAGNWRIWLILAGRGWGKTRTGAEDRGGGAAITRIEPIGIHGKTHGTTRCAPLKTSVTENFIPPFLLGLFFNKARFLFVVWNF